MALILTLLAFYLVCFACLVLLQMYKRNEAAFEHDVRRFMSRHGQQIRNTPVWHNVPVTLFQLYLSVNERGGFLQVSTHSKHVVDLFIWLGSQNFYLE